MKRAWPHRLNGEPCPRRPLRGRRSARCRPRLTGLARPKTPVPPGSDPGRRESSKRPRKNSLATRAHAPHSSRSHARRRTSGRRTAIRRPSHGARGTKNEARRHPHPPGVTRVAARPRSASHGWPPGLARRHTGGRQASLGVKEDLGTSRHSRAPSVIPATAGIWTAQPGPASAIPAKRDPGMTRTGTESQPRPGNPAGSEAARFPSSRE